MNEGNTHSFYINPNAEKKTASFTATIKGGGQTYIYLDCGAAKSMSASANGASGRKTWNVSPREPYIIDAGMLPEGESVSVSITADGACSGNIYVMTLDEEC